MKDKLLLMITLLAIVFAAGCMTLLSPADKIEPLPPLGKPDYGEIDYFDGEVLVRAASLGELEEAIGALDSHLLKEYKGIGWYLISVPAGQDVLTFIDDLEALPQIALAEPNMSWQIPPLVDDEDEKIILGSGTDYAPANLAATDFDKLWGMRNIKADQVWDITTGNEKVIVAVVDTGLALNHPEFAGHNIIAPWTPVGDGGGVGDFHGHGSHVTGTAAANGRKGNLAGVVWDCPIMPIRVMNREGSIANSWLGEAMIYIADYVVENPEYRAVVNMSIGGRGYSFMLKDAIDYAFERGVLLVTAAGNDYKRVMSFPGAYNGVVCVAASTQADRKAEFSTVGSWVSVAAPGVDIWSVRSSGGYVMNQGTSMASPHVCGAAALLLSQNPALTPLQIKNQLEASARPNSQGFTFDDEMGSGIIDCVALLGEMQPMRYGSLHVKTNITDTANYNYGLITVFDEAGQMAYFGSTGQDGSHKFNAILPGHYSVTLSHDRKIQGREEVYIEAGKLDYEIEFIID